MKLEIPHITDERLKELSAKIRPVFRARSAALRWIKVPKDLRGVSFLWDAQPGDVAEGLEKLAEVRTLHTYGYYGFFKPSIAEVLAQIPEDFIERAVAFETVGPSDAAELNEELDALNAGFHVATTTLYFRS